MDSDTDCCINYKFFHYREKAYTALYCVTLHISKYDKMGQ